MVQIKDQVIGLAVMVCLLLACLSLTIHASTFLAYTPYESSPFLWYGLQITSGLALITGLMAFGPRLKGRPGPTGWSLDKIFTACFVFFALYAIFNFLFTEFYLLQGGSPRLVEGNYAIGSHGHFTTVSKDEFLRAKLNEARLYSGHWVAFFLFAVSGLRWKAAQHNVSPAAPENLDVQV